MNRTFYSSNPISLVVSMKCFLFFAMLSTASKVSASGPLVGILYEDWFDYGQTISGCSGAGWKDNPFNLPPGHGQVMSLIPNINGGGCYSSRSQNTGSMHAKYLHHLGADFVIFDETNFSKTMMAANDPTYQASKQIIAGLKQYPSKTIQAVYQLSITCQGSNCFAPGFCGVAADSSYANDSEERFVGSDPCVTDHISDIAQSYTSDSSSFVIVNGKPLLLFYVNKGGNVYQYMPGHPEIKVSAFNGAGNLTPVAGDWNPSIMVNGQNTTVRDFFSVRFAVAAYSDFDYSAYAADIWPFSCFATNCTFTEAGFATLYSPAWGSRSIQQFSRLVDAAAGKPYLVVRSWNEFSSTDENQGASYTLEPNTQLANYDGSPNNDPWYFYNQVRAKLNSIKGYQVVSQNSGKCLDVVGVSTADGAAIQQYSCLGAGQTNQIWSLVPNTNLPTSGPIYYEAVSKNSQKCLTVPGNSQNDNTLIQQISCASTNTPGQYWQLTSPSGTSFYQFQPQSASTSHSECLDVLGVSMANGALVQQYNCLGASQLNQIWRVLWNGTQISMPPLGL